MPLATQLYVALYERAVAEPTVCFYFRLPRQPSHQRGTSYKQSRLLVRYELNCHSSKPDIISSSSLCAINDALAV